jgi:hypothetical protein
MPAMKLAMDAIVDAIDASLSMLALRDASSSIDFGGDAAMARRFSIGEAAMSCMDLLKVAIRPASVAEMLAIFLSSRFDFRLQSQTLRIRLLSLLRG